ncbi:MAG TPA: PQQ-dependent sugar dehydrogenase [Bryobacteraceae bacterium]|jgi:glucose/arabinose dehydrogenase|nr:PQQ-dependent sugar dehydrogenase [Bryobacteraceae bacterium]
MSRLFLSAIILVAAVSAQQRPPQRNPIGFPVTPLGDGPFLIDTAEQHRIRVVVVAKGLSHPWSLAFLPDGNMLVSERPGRLRSIRNGTLDPTPVSGVPQVHGVRLYGLMDIALHPKFAENRLIYLTYTKAPVDGKVSTALARGRFDGSALTDVRDLLETDRWEGAGSAARLTFGRDGMLYMATGAASGNYAQDPGSLNGKVLRLRDDGTVPGDNPFIGRAGYRPEIYTLGHRNQLGLAVHPQTGALWSNENGPNGGDEINIIQPGKNYGWPVISFGRTYEGPRVAEVPWREGMEPPLVFWVPSIAVSGMAFYTGDRFPAWKGNVFVGSMRTGEIPGTGHLERIVFNDKQEELRRETMLTDLRQRIRDVRQGPDGLLYLLTDEDPGAVLRIEPAP